MTASTLVKRIASFMLSKKAHNVVILNVKKLTSATDHFVICSGDSDTHVKAIADAVQYGLEPLGVRVWHREGYRALTWVVLDYVDVVVHVFHKETRSFYNLERLWSDAKKIEVKDKPESSRQISLHRRARLGKALRKSRLTAK